MIIMAWLLLTLSVLFFLAAFTRVREKSGKPIDSETREGDVIYLPSYGVLGCIALVFLFASMFAYGTAVGW